jgi:sec-independent protein translocase protein TatA
MERRIEMFGLGVPELIVIALIVLFLFGARRLPEIGEGLGRTVREIKKVSKDLRGGAKKEGSTSEKQSDPSEGENSAASSAVSDESGGMPGFEEIKTVTEKASQVRKWWSLLKR